MIPRLVDRERRGALAVVIGLGLIEATCLAVAALSLGRAIDAATALALGSAVGFAALAAIVSWTRAVAAEDFGARYSGALRRYLAAQAVSRGGEGRPGRLGVMAVRMTGDLNAMREWASIGLSETVAAGALLAAAGSILVLTVGPGGLWIAAAGLAPLVVTMALLIWPLMRAHEALRRERGRVAGLSGDIVQATRTLWALEAVNREGRRLDRRSEDLRRVSVRRRMAAAGIAAPAMAAAGLGGVAAALLVQGGVIMPLAGAAWAPVMLAMSFLATAATGFARALDQACAYKAGYARLSDAETDDETPNSNDAEKPQPQTPSGAIEAAGVGQVAWISDLEPQRAIARIEAAWLQACAGERRRVRLMLAAPSLPLVRASLARNLSLGRATTGKTAMRRAVASVGLDPAQWPIDGLIDPLDPRLDPWTQARLRLARAVAHAPKAVFIAEPLLAALPDYDKLIQNVASEFELNVVALRLEGQATAPAEKTRAELRKAAR